MKKYLITGGNGFIGANLVRLLLQKNKKVLVLIEPNADLWRLEDVLCDIGVIECDITNKQKVTQILSAIKPNVIFHLAALGVKPTNDSIKKLFRVNFLGTTNLLTAAKKTGFECFVTTGSASEYGEKLGPLAETSLLEPRDDYSISKAAATMYCYKEAIVNNLPIYIVRPFCAYGEFEPSHRLIPTIIQNYLAGRPIKLSSPERVRDFIYVKDVVASYLAIATQKPEQRIFNIGTGRQHTIKNVVETMQLIVEKKLIVEWNASQPRPWELSNWQADITYATTQLDWKPNHTLHSGLQKTLAWFEQNDSRSKTIEGARHATSSLS